MARGVFGRHRIAKGPGEEYAPIEQGSSEI